MQRASPISIAEWTIHCWRLSWGKNTTNNKTAFANENSHENMLNILRAHVNTIFLKETRKSFRVHVGPEKDIHCLIVKLHFFAAIAALYLPDWLTLTD